MKEKADTTFGEFSSMSSARVLSEKQIWFHIFISINK